MNYLELFLGQIPEAIYFFLFLIYTKKLNKHDVLLGCLMVFEYCLFLHALPYSVWSHILFFVSTYLLFKWRYKEKVQVTDLFTLMIASLLLTVISVISFLLCHGDMIIGSIINRSLLFGTIYITKDKLPNIQKLYKRFWNRNDKANNPIKSTTFRAINVILLNISIWLLNACMIIALIYNNR